ncbi:hypothetical protein A1O3_07880 [Capronia epimyces CBS 606.96]|uniref:Uncharacterized protein n=1 Tax=Capronia epimyces CBS 606.96 TaxID=1182542 RepID=W9XRI3_9EURO|nr:uncharacterized protein A1O3_07880 [Capronia epimyces CBS 606.96]EXJ79601.1 hypothetical protein A1O3_07880 [Capronia epimyces CBS 606.96]
MSSRYPPPARDRSPSRYDRRPSAPYNSLGSSYRGQADIAPPSSDRPPPRGPKADSRGGASLPYSFASRGRGGFPARSADTWDRDRERDRDRDRDGRPGAPSYRGRDDDRVDWPRRDRDFGPGDRGVSSVREGRPYTGRDRSASPSRARRDSRESVPTGFPRPPDSASSYYTPAARGGLGRGRGRGDWDRGRGRSSLVGERDRDLFHPRSRSRDGWRDRDFERGRPLPSDAERSDRYDWREHDRSRERDSRGRDHDLWPREQSPGKSSVGTAGGITTTPAAATADRPGRSAMDIIRRLSTAPISASSVRDGRRDEEQADYFGGPRTDLSRREASQSTQQPSAITALDYGPPPPVPSVTTPATETSAPPKSQVLKADSTTNLSSTFQPPSGPKAARTSSAATPGHNIKAAPHHDSWNRPDGASRPLRSSLTPTASNISSDTTIKKDEPVAEPKPPTAPAANRAMPPNVPSGPRLATAPPYRQRLPSTEPIGSALAPTVSRESAKSTVPDTRSPVIPTGPRLDREAARQLPGTGSKIWVSPDYKPKPSVINPSNKPYQLEGRDRTGAIPTGPRQQSTFHNAEDKAKAVSGSFNSVPSVPSGSRALVSTSPHIQGEKITLYHPKESTDQQQQSTDVEMPLPASSEDEDEAEDDSFDEEYFKESEERFRREMTLLEARMPPPLLQDESIVALLIRLQFLEMLLKETLARPPDTSAVTTKEEEISVPVGVSTGLPSPDRASNESDTRLENDEDQRPYPKGRPLKQPHINPIPTPPIEDLPYLKVGPPGRIVFEDSDNEVEHEAVSILLQQEFERSAWDWRSDLEDMHAEFRRKYPLWKQEVVHLDHERRDQQASPAPASPAPSVTASVTPSLTHERTRGARNTTEADLQAAILMSQQSLKEEEERREREAASSSHPNYDLEAVIPPMLNPADAELSKFEETNGLTPTELALDVFCYLPPEDDFTEEEQTLFIAAYCQYPKKWGKIAESIPGRTYQDCILHYYLTKNQAHYKDLWRRSQPRKKRGRAATKPRSTALMSELDYRNDPDAAPVAVTDSGRPRRAAAPTFGDAASEADSSTPVPQSKKPAASVKDGSAEPVSAKTTRGRKAGIATRNRRTKAQIQADQQAQLLSATEAPAGKTAASTKGEKTRPVLHAENVPIRQEVAPIPQVQRAADVLVQQYPVSDISSVPAAVLQNPVMSQVTSYWSVPEQHKFPELLAYFGHDYAAIAEFMKTKSVTMIKNYFLRQLNDGKEELERLAQKGDQMRMASDVLGQPPSPIIPPKRRYDATSTLGPAARPTTQIDQTMADPEVVVSAIKQGIIEDFPRNTVERNAIGEVVSKPRPVAREVIPAITEAPLPGAALAKAEETPRLSNDRGSLYGPKPLHGPRSGVFQDEHLGFPPSRQPLRGPPHELPSQIHAQRPQDLPRTESSQPAPMSAVTHTILGQRDPVVQPHQRPQGSGATLVQVPQSQGDNYDQQPMYRPSHSRTNSAATPSHVPLDPAQDLLPSRRRIENQRILYGMGPTVSPAPASTPIPASQPLRVDMPQPASAPPPAEPSKPTGKRSNVFGLLNDDPLDPPPKRPSLDAATRQSMRSPQIAPVPAAQPLLQPSRSQTVPDDLSVNRAVRTPYGHGGIAQTASGQQAPAEYPGGFSATPVCPLNNEVTTSRPAQAIILWYLREMNPPWYRYVQTLLEVWNEQHLIIDGRSWGRSIKYHMHLRLRLNKLPSRHSSIDQRLAHRSILELHPLDIQLPQQPARPCRSVFSSWHQPTHNQQALLRGRAFPNEGRLSTTSLASRFNNTWLNRTNKNKISSESMKGGLREPENLKWHSVTETVSASNSISIIIINSSSSSSSITRGETFTSLTSILHQWCLGRITWVQRLIRVIWRSLSARSLGPSRRLTCTVTITINIQARVQGAWGSPNISPNTNTNTNTSTSTSISISTSTRTRTRTSTSTSTSTSLSLSIRFRLRRLLLRPIRPRAQHSNHTTSCIMFTIHSSRMFYIPEPQGISAP